MPQADNETCWQYLARLNNAHRDLERACDQFGWSLIPPALEAPNLYRAKCRKRKGSLAGRIVTAETASGLFDAVMGAQ